MSAATVCDGPKCHEVKAESDRWIEMTEDGALYDFHAAHCLENWLNPMTEEGCESSFVTRRVVLEGHVIGTNRDMGLLFFKGADLASQHHPWTYQLHWSTVLHPVERVIVEQP
jgi:hypothetical protein